MASTFRWGPMWDLSTVSSWPLASYISPRWSPRRLLRWSGMMSVSIVDELVWRVVTAFESVALVSMLCFFFLFCGCTFWSCDCTLPHPIFLPLIFVFLAPHTPNCWWGTLGVATGLPNKDLVDKGWWSVSGEAFNCLGSCSNSNFVCLLKKTTSMNTKMAW